MKLIASALYFSPVFAGLIGYQLHSYMAGAAGALGCILLMVIGIKVRKLPIVQWRKIDGANGRNWPLLVIMDPDAAAYKAVLAQEIWESIHKTNPINLLKTRSGKGAQELELMGHEIEVQVAVLLYGVKEHEYRKREAESMKGYPQFKGWETPDIVDGMMDKTNAAQSWVAKNQTRFA